MNKITRTGSLVLSLTLALRAVLPGQAPPSLGRHTGSDKVYVPQYTKLEGLAGRDKPGRDR